MEVAQIIEGHQLLITGLGFLAFLCWAGLEWTKLLGMASGTLIAERWGMVFIVTVVTMVWVIPVLYK